MPVTGAATQRRAGDRASWTEKVGGRTGSLRASTPPRVSVQHPCPLCPQPSLRGPLAAAPPLAHPEARAGRQGAGSGATHLSPGRISLLSPGSCFPNWLQGKPSTTRPKGLSSSWRAFSSAVGKSQALAWLSDPALRRKTWLTPEDRGPGRDKSLRTAVPLQVPSGSPTHGAHQSLRPFPGVGDSCAPSLRQSGSCALPQGWTRHLWESQVDPPYETLAPVGSVRDWSGAGAQSSCQAHSTQHRQGKAKAASRAPVGLKTASTWEALTVNQHSSFSHCLPPGSLTKMDTCLVTHQAWPQPSRLHFCASLETSEAACGLHVILGTTCTCSCPGPVGHPSLQSRGRTGGLSSPSAVSVLKPVAAPRIADRLLMGQ